MLIALVLTLEPAVEASIPAFLGQATHAWFLAQVQQAAPRFSQALHDDRPTKPFTASSLWFQTRQPLENSVRLSIGQHCYVRITSVESALSRYVLDTLVPGWTGATIYLCGVPFHVRNVALSSAEHPQAACVSYETLIQNAARSRPPADLTLQFLSPTVFRRTPPRDAPFGDEPRNVPFPLPELVFGGLLAVWNTFAPQPIPGELLEFARDCVVVSRYSLQTRLVEFSGGRRGRVGGFEGTCRFAIRSPGAAWGRHIALLAAFAPLAGIGWRTAMGLGQTRLVGANTASATAPTSRTPPPRR